MTELKLEVWKSDQNRHERHFFVPGDGKGYQPDGQYFLGYNPDLISEEQINQILALLNASYKPGS